MLIGLASDWLETEQFQLVVKDVMRMLRNHMGDKTFFISHMTNDEFTVLESIGDSINLQKGLTLPTNQTVCSNMSLENIRPLVIPDTSKHELTKNSQMIKTLGIGSYLGVPLLLNNSELFGTLCVLDDQPYEFTEIELDTIKTVSNLMAIAIEMYRNSMLDYATGLYNKGYLSIAMDRIEKEIDDKVSSVVLFDVDDFKKINDTYGHGVGDEVLSFIGKTIKASIPESSIPLRFGGDEFCIITSGYTAKEMIPYVETLITSVNNYSLKGLTLSVGLSDTSISSKISVLDTADIALYKAKNKGKNQYFIYND